MRILALLFLLFPAGDGSPDERVFLPINAVDRHSTRALALTGIGGFGVMRKARPGIPAHYHAGIDLKRSGGNYADEPVYPIACGRVISKRDDGPYAQLIIEHELDGQTVWSVYEHIGGIVVDLSSTVDPLLPIARFLSREELQRYGWQFDHVHLELLKVKPVTRKPDARHPERFCSSYTLACRSVDDLQKYFISPVEFFEKRWGETSY